MLLEIINFASTTSQSFPIANHARMGVDPKGITTTSLPKHVMALLDNPQDTPSRLSLKPINLVQAFWLQTPAPPTI
jgi:hypothetical protein